jgi:hypothetical protein
VRETLRSGPTVETVAKQPFDDVGSEVKVDFLIRCIQSGTTGRHFSFSQEKNSRNCDLHSLLWVSPIDEHHGELSCRNHIFIALAILHVYLIGRDEQL